MTYLHSLKLLRIGALSLLTGLGSIGLSACGPSDASPAQEEAHDHDDGADEHGADEQAEQGDEEHAGEDTVRLTNAQLEASGVAVAPLAGGPITTHLTLPAEIGVNQDTLVHVTPRVPGVVLEVLAFLGDDVEPGQTLAVLESSELGEAKIALLQALQQRTMAQAALELQQTVSANTETLLALLRNEPELELLRNESAGLRIGENKGRLISAYARVRAAEANYARERTLRGKGLSTEADLLAAQEAYNSALAEYMAVFEEVDFMYRVRLEEAQRAASVANSAVENARRRLALLGLSAEEIDAIAQEPPERIARYEVAAPIAGRIIEKHIAPGEKIESDRAAYTIADLSTVWLNIAVYAEYLDRITEGQSVVVHADGREAAGKVTYIASTLTEGTRTVTARVVLENAQRKWKAGEFLTVRIETGQEQVARRVPIEAVQQWEGGDVVFVRHDDGSFAPHPIEIGRRNDRFVEIVGDDPPIGAPIVVANSFLFKAELGKGAAGHSH